MSEDFVPTMEEWWTLPQAADHLGITRQAAHLMMKAQKFESIRRLGDQARPIYVVRASEIQEMVRQRDAHQTELLKDEEPHPTA